MPPCARASEICCASSGSSRSRCCRTGAATAARASRASSRPCYARPRRRSWARWSRRTTTARAAAACWRTTAWTPRYLTSCASPANSAAAASRTLSLPSTQTYFPNSAESPSALSKLTCSRSPLLSIAPFPPPSSSPCAISHSFGKTFRQILRYLRKNLAVFVRRDASPTCFFTDVHLIFDRIAISGRSCGICIIDAFLYYYIPYCGGLPRSRFLPFEGQESSHGRLCVRIYSMFIF